RAPSVPRCVRSGPGREPRWPPAGAAASASADLRSLARLGQAGLLPLDLPRIAGQEPGPLQRHAHLRIDLHEGAGDPVPNGAGLAGRASTVDTDPDVVRALET